VEIETEGNSIAILPQPALLLLGLAYKVLWPVEGNTQHPARYKVLSGHVS
jgi:hypothetical protein